MKLILLIIPLIAGFLIDAVVGDPYWMPHPIRSIGKLISYMEKITRERFDDLKKGGVFLGLTVVTLSTMTPAAILFICYRISIYLGIAAETVMCSYMLAGRCLMNESMKVCREAENGDVESARKAVSMIVGRDTAVLDKSGIVKAAVETVAENTSDGVTAPMFYMGIGGASAGFFYKAVNTMDSMIGYKNEKYADIGRFAAKLDDILNYIPSRLTALLMIAVCPFLGYDSRNAWRIWKRDRRNHASPNSAQTESACAGALHLRLAGDALYFGELHKKPYIGDDDRAIEPDDIRKANKLMYCTSILMLIISVAIRAVIIGGIIL
ncbi:MAG: adenosylcobinamide-phosphate synthase CbiB [Ruminococcus sp.]|nr:adenosylcobinamide-phosphate synthase CbiB [Ruminococcus sp.]